jgi:hypothetical protein
MAAVLAGLAIWCAGDAWSQEPGQPAPAPPAAGSDQPLSLRYRFVEKYSLAEDPNRPELLVQYQVGADETYRVETERPQGAPQQAGWRKRTVYTERPARLGRLGDVTDAVRRYDRFEPFSLNGTRNADPRADGLFRDLTLWYHLQAGRDAEVISLTANRTLREEEYQGVIDDQLFLPGLKAILPPNPTRVEDTWSIARAGVQALMGKEAGAADFQVDGTLVQVNKAARGTALTAIIDISGKVALQEGDGAVRARISFIFEPPAAAPAAETREPAGRAGGGGGRDAGVVEATGYIAKVQMRRVLTVPLQDEPRLQQIITRDLVLHRRRAPDSPGAVPGAPLVIPEQPPSADESNSWLLYHDPEGRFHFRHPQELSLSAGDRGFIVFQYVRADGRADTVMIWDIPKEGDSARDRRWDDPQAFVKYVSDGASRKGFDVINGPMGYLPDQDWAPLKRRVYRYEAALKRKDASRVYLDAYLVLFTRGDHFVLQALTEHNDHVAFRDKVERLIKSLELGPSTSARAGTPAQPQAAPPAATRPTPESPAPAVPRGGTP